VPGSMKLIPARDVLRLTGLTADQLREWTSRRGLIPADTKPNGPGSRALFSWQTVLALRVAIALKAHQSTLASFIQHVRGTSFPALRGRLLLIGADGSVRLAPASAATPGGFDGIVLHLDPHLEVLASSFDVVDAIHQLPLFPAVVVR
jgi:hypothetical protein